MTTLFNLATEYQSVHQQLTDENYSLETINDTLESISLPLEQKINNTALMSKDLAIQAEAIRNHAKQMLIRANDLENKSLWLKDYLKLNMLRCNMKKFNGIDCKVVIRNNPPKVNITDNTLIPANYWRQPETPPPEINKRMISEDLKLGVKINGAELVQTQSIEISG